MNIKIRALLIALAAITIMGTCACGKKSSDASSKASVGYEEMTLGKDCTDIKAELKILTNRTDLIEQDTNGRNFQDYIEEFNAMYPNKAFVQDLIINECENGCDDTDRIWWVQCEAVIGFVNLWQKTDDRNI